MVKQLAALILFLMLLFSFLIPAIAEDDKAMMSMAPMESSKIKISTPIEFYINLINLNAYSAFLTGEAACKGDKECLDDSGRLKAWSCMSQVCDGSKKEPAKPSQCFSGIEDDFTSDQQEAINATICDLIKTPNAKSIRQTFLKAFPDLKESSLIPNLAYLLAAKESAKSCIDFIKGFLGPNAPAWSVAWYKTLSGCRIIARQSTLEQEELDFYTWIGAYRQFNCFGISNPELFNACQSGTSASPSPYASESNEKEPLYLKSIVDRIGLNMYEAAYGKVSSCQNDESCLQNAKKVKAALCIAKVCPGNATDKHPAGCFEDSFGNLSDNVKAEIDKTYCAAVSAGDEKSLQLLKKYFPKTPEKVFVEFEAYLLAAWESSTSCQNYIKHYVGPYGLQWNYEWYRALSGCRIISQESTREKEEADFYTWLATRRQFSCSNIMDGELRTVCPTRDIMKEFLPK